tara:strand:+ start:1532 stop:3397 length:1866 start_codon:yes stop_codon:yes gene_type:complete
MKKYYYSSNGIDKNGPVTLEELKQIKIDPKTMVWFEGLDNWVNAEEINELNSLFTSPKINLDKKKLNKKNSTSTVANSKKKKRKWVLPIVILSLIIFSVIVRSGLKSNNSVVQEISVEKIENELENKYIEPLKIAEPENSYEEEQIKGMLLAEDDRNFSQVIKYYDLKNLKRYWNYNKPTYDQLKSQYEKSWNYTDNSSNTIKSIIKIKEKTYDVNLDFSYFHKKDNIYKVANSDVRFVFNDNAKIIEVYGVSEQNVEKKQDVIVADKAYFYLTPDLSSIKKTYLIKGDKFTYTNSDNEFVNATFTNSKGVTTNGWILESTFLDMESQSVINLNEKENNEVIRELGTSSFRIKINNNVKNLNIRNNPVDGDIIAKISGGEIYTVIKVFEASKPIYLLKNQMSFKDIETGEDIEKPNDYKLSNLRLIGDDLFYAEVFNSDNTFNKIHINKNNFKIEYNNWFYLKELKGWMYSKFGEKIVFRKDPVNNKDIDDQTKTEKNTVLETEDKAKDRENKMSDFNKGKEKRKVIFSLEHWYSSERNSKGVFLKQLKSSKKQIIKSYNIKLKEIVIYRMPGNYNREESFTAYIFSNITDLKIFKEMISINENVELYYENLEKHTLYYIN